MERDTWQILKKYTNARIALGRAGSTLPTQEILQFKMAHALARDAVSSEIDRTCLAESFRSMGIHTIVVQSQVTDRNDYLRNPNKGRVLDNQSKEQLQSLKDKPMDLCIVVADGLSADAVNLYAVPLVDLLIRKLDNWTLTPVILARYSRVALSDPIGEIVGSRIALILIGERPGLSAPRSLGAYLTYQPKTGNTDEKRNCISNIHPDGLTLGLAAAKIVHLLYQMRTKQISGILLKDDQSDLPDII